MANPQTPYAQFSAQHRVNEKADNDMQIGEVKEKVAAEKGWEAASLRLIYAGAQSSYNAAMNKWD